MVGGGDKAVNGGTCCVNRSSVFAQPEIVLSWAEPDVDASIEKERASG
jgi:hypothetical protein